MPHIVTRPNLYARRLPIAEMNVTPFIDVLLVLLIMVGSGVAIALVYPTMKQELAPLEDRGTILATINAPAGMSPNCAGNKSMAWGSMPWLGHSPIF